MGGEEAPGLTAQATVLTLVGRVKGAQLGDQGGGHTLKQKLRLDLAQAHERQSEENWDHA